MKIFMTGGTGFVGRRLIRDLLNRGHNLICLCRAGSEKKLGDSIDRVRIVAGDLSSPDSIRRGTEGADAVIHLAGIIREFPRRGATFEAIHVDAVRRLVDTAQSLNVRRFIHISALGAHSRALSRYHQTKYRAEDIVRRSDLVYTIFRPSVIFGPGDAFVSMLAAMTHRSPIIPIIGSGDYKMQPVALQDVTSAIVHALDNPNALYKTYSVGGPQALSYNEIIRTIFRVLGKRRPMIHVPPGLVWAQAAVLDHLPFFPITRDQLLMLLQDNVADDDMYASDFGIEPIRFEDGIRRTLRPT